MTSSTEVRRESDSGQDGTDTATLLNGLIERGYRFVHPRDPSGEVVAVVGVRAHGSVIDVVRLDAEDDVTAIRMPGGESDILAPETVLWKESGSVAKVVEKVLSLPDEHAHHGSDSRGCWVSADTGRAKWLAAS